jgi:hypothetical protein
MPADLLHALDILSRRDLPPADLMFEAATLLCSTIRADWTGLLTVCQNVQSYQVVHHHPALSISLLAYLEQRTRVVTPLARIALDELQPLYIDHYAHHPSATRGAVALGVGAVAHLPFSQEDGCTYVVTFLRTTDSTTRIMPWREDERALMGRATRSIQAALAGKSSCHSCSGR